VLTAILAIPLLGEALFPLQIIGGILALIGIYIVNRFGR
jgi:drug/metabolite transporter (DMT)-like permease